MVLKTDSGANIVMSDDSKDTAHRPTIKDDSDASKGMEERLSGLYSLSAKDMSDEDHASERTVEKTNDQNLSLEQDSPEISKPEISPSNPIPDHTSFEEPKIFKPISGMDIEQEDLDAVILTPRSRSNSTAVDVPDRTSDEKEIEEEYGILLPKSSKFGAPNTPSSNSYSNNDDGSGLSTDSNGDAANATYFPENKRSDPNESGGFEPIVLTAEEENELKLANSTDISFENNNISSTKNEGLNPELDDLSTDAGTDIDIDAGVVGDTSAEYPELPADIPLAENSEAIDEVDPTEKSNELTGSDGSSASVNSDKMPAPVENVGIIQKIKNLFHRENQVIEAYDPELHGPLSYFDGLEDYEELDRYWVNEPYVFIVILYNEKINNHLYYAVEPTMSDFEHVFLAEIQDRLRNELLVEELDEDEDKGTILENEIREIITDYAIEITPAMLEKIFYYIKRDFINFGKIDPLMNDESIEDISGNGHSKPIFLYHRSYQNIPTNIIFDEIELNSFIIQLAQRSGKHISVAEPMVDATMPDGSRIQMTLGTSVTTHGSTFTIRKFNEVPITPVDLLKWRTFSPEAMAYLWLCIENNKSLIYAGGTASGKTSSLNAVSLFIPEKSKIISLEDTRELKLPHPNWIPGVTRDSFTADERGAVDMYDLLKAALRQRPEYLLVGEVRGKEALTLFQAMSTGHTTFSTMHADSVPSAIHRLENPPISVPRNMIQALDIMCIQAQTYSKGERVRRNLKLVEIIDIDPNTRNVRTNDVFVWDSLTDTFHRTGESKALVDIRTRRGWSSTDVSNELRNRQRVLEHMVNNEINDFKQISTIINMYQSTPERALKELGLL